MSLNKVMLIGRVGADPDIRTFQSGDRVANISVATSEKWKDKSTGETKEVTEWHRVAITNQNIVKVVEQWVKKGSSVYIEGAIKYKKYTDKEGVEKYTTEISVGAFNGSLQLLGSKSDGQAQPAQTPHHEAKANGYAPQPVPAARPVIDDDIPF